MVVVMVVVVEQCVAHRVSKEVRDGSGRDVYICTNRIFRCDSSVDTLERVDGAVTAENSAAPLTWHYSAGDGAVKTCRDTMRMSAGTGYAERGGVRYREGVR